MLFLVFNYWFKRLGCKLFADVYVGSGEVRERESERGGVCVCVCLNVFKCKEHKYIPLRIERVIFFLTLSKYISVNMGENQIREVFLISSKNAYDINHIGSFK